MNRRTTVWAASLGVPAAVIAGALIVPMQASAAVDLPDKTADEVLAMIGDGTATSFSGTIEQSSDLGLPALPTGAGSEGTASALELLTGSHTARVFIDGATRSRIQVLDSLAERDIIRNGAEVWYYNSDEEEATHATLPEREAERPAVESGTPSELAAKLVDALDESSTLTVDDDTLIAGRTAYDLVLTPDDADTLVGSVSIAVDSETGLPLRVRITAVGQEAPAFETAFTDLTVGAQDASLFDFTAPPGTDVTELEAPADARPDAGAPSPDAAEGPRPTVIGEGWSSVVELPAGTVPAEAAAEPMLDQVTERVDGGRVLSTSLITVLLTDDGRLLAGSVPVETLLAAAAG